MFKIFYIYFSDQTVEVVTCLDRQNALISSCHDGICDSIQSKARTGMYTSGGLRISHKGGLDSQGSYVWKFLYV